MRRRHALAAAAFTTIVAAALSTLGAQAPPPADLIVHNALVYTVDARNSRASAIAVNGSRITFVGDDAGALGRRGPSTRVIDAGGRSIVPGLHDAHGHFTGLGESLQRLDLRGTTSFAQIVGMVKERVGKAAPGEWILGRAWDQNDWANPAWPTRDALDAVSPNNPVFLTRVDGHAAIANTLALRIAEVRKATPDPEGGRYIRDAAGNPTGVMIDRAMGLVGARVPDPTPRQLEEQILLADAEARKLGLTMVHDAGVSRDEVEAYKRLIDRGALQTRLYVMLGGPLAQLEPFFKAGPITNYGDHHLAVRAIKIGADGALGSRGAAMLAPYSDEPGTSGFLTTPEAEIYARTLAASKAGFQTCIHAIGDRTNRVVMDVFERVQREVPGTRALRMRNEHAQVLDPAEIPRFKALEVIASMQATHATSDMPWVATRIGPSRTDAGAYVWKKLIAAGAVLANGSDFPVEEPNPMLGLYASVTRQDRQGQPPGGWMPAERLTRDEMLRSFTINAAYAAHAEAELGSIEVGKLADFVMLSADVMSVPAPRILETTVVRTVIGGRIVYEAP